MSHQRTQCRWPSLALTAAFLWPVALGAHRADSLASAAPQAEAPTPPPARSNTPRRRPAPSQQEPEKAPPPDWRPMLDAGVAFLLSAQEGDENAEWPYEGVYRVGGQIPIGYRIGGTSICAMALIQAPGYADDSARQQAVARATRFILGAIEHPLMNPDYNGGYDVRGWGYTYALTFLLRMQSLACVPQDSTEAVAKAIAWLIDAIQQTEISGVGGWSYSRPQGKGAASPPSPFMSGPTLQVLFEARKMGFEVDAQVVQRGLKSLEQARTPSGSVRYAGLDGERSRESVPGSVGRMLVTETTLHLAGRSSVANVRSALDAFIVHWQWLEKRRAQQGTHVPPYGIAPYYFFYAHYYAAQAIEVLPEQERGEYRRRVNELLLSVRDIEKSTWNDRVFPRSASYGTAMAMMSLMMPQSPSLARWE